LKHEGNHDEGLATNTRETEPITCQPRRILLLTSILPIIRYNKKYNVISRKYNDVAHVSHTLKPKT